MRYDDSMRIVCQTVPLWLWLVGIYVGRENSKLCVDRKRSLETNSSRLPTPDPDVINDGDEQAREYQGQGHISTIIYPAASSYSPVLHLAPQQRILDHDPHQ